MWRGHGARAGGLRLAASGLALTAAAAAGCTAGASGSGPPGPPRASASNPGSTGGTAGPAGTAARVGAVTVVSHGCGGQNAEPETATAPPRYVYVTWIGCGGIGFARSTDGGQSFVRPRLVPGSRGGTWDPAIAVAPDGTVYIAYMRQAGRRVSPVVAASFDHGVSFRQVVALVPPAAHNFGDRDFLAVSRSGVLYLTWDYGPSARLVRTLCSAGGSCAFSAGDLNAVIQRSTDRGRTWGPIVSVAPGFPRNGGIAAPLLITPGGRVDVLYLGHHISPRSYLLHPGHEFFTSSAGGGRWPRHPLALWPGAGPVTLREWWIDASLAADAGGNLYATWDTQTRAGDTGWLAVSTNGGRAWRRPVRVTGSRRRAPHILAVVGGRRGTAYVAWQTSAPRPGYATYLRRYSLGSGWSGAAVRVSPRYGERRVWPGDTIGLAALAGSPGASPQRLAMSWGSAAGHQRDSQIYATVVTLP